MVECQQQQLKKCSQVLAIAHDVGQGLKKEKQEPDTEQGNEESIPTSGHKEPRQIYQYPAGQMTIPTSPQQSVCNFCQKPGNFQCNCRMANILCLACGSGNHLIKDCPFKRVCRTKGIVHLKGNVAPVQPALQHRQR